MKYCPNSHNCPWGSTIEPGLCAYSTNVEESDECPMIFQDMEMKMDKLCAGVQVQRSSRLVTGPAAEEE